jgi:hypothetical protein
MRESDGKNDINTWPNRLGTGTVFKYIRGHLFDASFPAEVNGTALKDGFISVFPLGICALNGIRPNLGEVHAITSRCLVILVVDLSGILSGLEECLRSREGPAKCIRHFD